jgi:hypothetical protein
MFPANFCGAAQHNGLSVGSELTSLPTRARDCRRSKGAAMFTPPTVTEGFVSITPVEHCNVA